MSHWDVAGLAAVLARNIPLTTAMGLMVRRADDAGLVLGVPFAPNVNHQRTFFAGSLNAAATLAGWGLLWLAARRYDVPANIVIQDSTTQYLRPGAGDCEAVCPWPDAADLATALEAVRQGRRARIALTATVGDGAKTVVAFSGRYVLLPLDAWPALLTREGPA